MEELKGAGKTELDGMQAFRLFDTYGFPLDLTELICRENGFTVNEAQFDVEMQKQKERARNAAAVENSDWVELAAGEQQFVGYDYTEYECRILRYRKVTQKKNEFFELVLDNTPFYGEMGGQVGDCGVLCNEAQARCFCRQPHRYPPARLCLETGAGRSCGTEGLIRIA